MSNIKTSRYKPLKEGQLANFPEEGSVELMSHRHLAIAVSLVLILSAFAALIAPDSPTGYASAPIKPITKLPNLRTTLFTARTVTKAPIVVPPNYYCPKKALFPTKEYAPSANTNRCFMKNNGRTYDFMCMYQGRLGTKLFIECIPR